MRNRTKRAVFPDFGGPMTPNLSWIAFWDEVEGAPSGDDRESFRTKYGSGDENEFLRFWRLWDWWDDPMMTSLIDDLYFCSATNTFWPTNFSSEKISKKFQKKIF